MRQLIKLWHLKLGTLVGFFPPKARLDTERFYSNIKEGKMTIGPGKYDELATIVRSYTKAPGVMVVVMGGAQGSGFSCQFEHPAFLKRVPELLRQMADTIEKDEKEQRK
jgi:hypothetical protein